MPIIYSIFYVILYLKLSKINSEEYSCTKLNSSIEHLTDFKETYVFLSLNIYNAGSSFTDICISCNASFSFIDYIQIYTDKKLILDNSLNLTELKLTGNEKPIMIFVYNLMGIDIKTETFNFLASAKTDINLIIGYSKFDLFLNGKILNEAACNDVKTNNFQNNFFSKIKKFNFGSDISFGKNKLCPFLFNNSELTQITVFYHTNSFIKKNMFEFTQINETMGKTIHLKNFFYFFMYMTFDTVSTKIVNQYVFKNIQQLRISGFILNIQFDLFKYFNNMNTVILNTIKIRTLFHNGNDWLRYLKYSYHNSSLNTNYSFPNLILILINDYEQNTLTDLYEYNDEDFCLFSSFPHEKLVYPLIQPGRNVLINCSCTLLYLIKYDSLYVYLDKLIMSINASGEFDNFANSYCKLELLKRRCNFTTRLAICKKSDFSVKTESSFDLTLKVNLELIFSFLEYLIIVILNPIFSFFGIITNLMVMVVVNNIKNLKKDKIKETNKTRDHMFRHIFVHSAFNSLFCVISILKLVNECTTIDLFCSGVFKSIGSQWFDVVMIEFFGGLIKLCCNVSYIFITVTRLLIMKKKATTFKRFLHIITDVRIWIYLIFLILIGVLLNAFKLFEYKIDVLFFNNGDTSRTNKDFPTDNYNYISCYYKQDKIMCYFFKTLKLINSFINNILFFFVTILFDVLLMKNLNDLIAKKKSMVENFKENEEEKKKKKLSKMVFIGNIIYLFSHMPEFLLTILFIIFEEKLYNICYMDLKCDKIYEQTQVFIFISISSQFYINKNFNKVFKESYRNIVLKIRSKFSIFKSSETNDQETNTA